MPLVPRLAGLLPIGIGLLIGFTACGPPPAADDETPATPPATPGGSGSPAPTFPGSGVPGSPAAPGTGFAEEIALACGGQPSEQQMLEVLRDQDILGPDAEAEVIEGPLCAGTWQWATIRVPDLDPLQVVTRGEPDALELVTAGTDVCNVEVRIQAPAGIQGAAGCQG